MPMPRQYYGPRFEIHFIVLALNQPEAEFKDLEPGLKFETRLKYGVFHFIFNILRFKLVFGGF